MSLTAKEWLLLPEKDQKRRGSELSPHECFLLRTVYSHVHFTEQEKAEMSDEKRNAFLQEIAESDRERLRQQNQEMFEKMIKNTTSQ